GNVLTLRWYRTTFRRTEMADISVAVKSAAGAQAAAAAAAAGAPTRRPLASRPRARRPAGRSHDHPLSTLGRFITRIIRPFQHTPPGAMLQGLLRCSCAF